MKRTVYRDTKTGRFASKKTWERSKSGRYKRQTVKIKKEKEIPVPVEVEEEVHEWVISFSYDKNGRNFDMIVTARNGEEAYRVAKIFLEHDKKGKSIYRANFHGWTHTTAKGKLTNEEAGEAEYRQDSKTEG
jgi:hypothetical protein